jgi:hypothetical protein
MVKRLELQEDDVVLEPSAGDGVFIDEVIKKQPNINITALDINPEAISTLNNKYADKPNIKVINTDTLLDEQLDNYVIENGRYTKIIGNPPYGAWQDYEKRDFLKKKYKGFYVKESYAIFLLRCISLLKENGILSFIIPDTFMNLHMHNRLREFLLLNTKIKEIVIFPSSFFPGVSFQYSKMCIITVKKVVDFNKALDNEIRIISGLKKAIDLDDITNERDLSKYNEESLKQKDIYDSVDKAFLLQGGEGIRNLINNIDTKLGDIADCVTGIYTGDNKRFFKVANDRVRNQSKCPIIEENEINNDYLQYENILEGIEGERHFIPVVKGAADNYIRNIDWYIDWGKEAINFYNTEKKARFQNSQFYFKTGIALPMVKSSKIKANLIENMVFDQSVVGVFPKEDKHLYYLLGLFNSEVFTKIVHTINPTANNSANYIKKVPLIIEEEGIKHITSIVKKIIEAKRETGKVDSKLQQKIDEYFNAQYKEWLNSTDKEEVLA